MRRQPAVSLIAHCYDVRRASEIASKRIYLKIASRDLSLMTSAAKRKPALMWVKN